MKSSAILYILLNLYLLYNLAPPVIAQERGKSGQSTIAADSPGQENLVEKIHLHFDRSYYSAGDTIWFKSYLVDRSNQLTEHSQVLHVDLLDGSGTTLQSLKVPLVAGLGWGDIPLDRELPSGPYLVIAYTNWLRNFGEEFFFRKTLQISDVAIKQVVASSRVVRMGDELMAQVSYKGLDGLPLAQSKVSYSMEGKDGKPVKGQLETDANGLLKIPVSDAGGLLKTTLDTETGPVLREFRLPSAEDGFDVQFFPEGGELVTNVPTRLGVKVTGTDGLGKEASGYITNQDQVHIASFETGFGGMGLFGLNPQAGEQYKAHVTVKNGQNRSFPLPISQSSGYVMTVSSDPKTIIIRIKGSTDKEGAQLSLQAQANGRTWVNIRETLRLPQLVIRIPKTELPAGISRLTLSTGEGVPVAERLVFIDRIDELTVTLGQDKGEYPLASEIREQLKATGPSGKPVLGSFSLSVTDESRAIHYEETESTILSNLLLSSELSGHIEGPNYYFTNMNDDKQHELDILMMTQGWRKFVMDTTRNLPLTFEAEKSLRISGKVLTPLNSPVASSMVSLVIGNGSEGILTTKSNERGEFAFDSLYFEGRTKLSLSAQNSRGRSSVNLVLDSLEHPPPVIGRLKQKPVMLHITDSAIVARTDEDEVKRLLRRAEIRKMQLLDEVTVTAQRVKAIKGSANINATPTPPMYVLTEEHFDRYAQMEYALHRQIPNLEIRGNNLFFRNMNYPFIVVYIDGAPMDSTFRVQEINVADVAGIELLTGAQAAVYGEHAILFVTMKSGNPKSSPQMGQTMVSLDGYRFDRQFYSPRFDHPQQNQSPDLRKTIYWNPNLLTLEGLSPEFSFYTGNKPGRYRFVIEGVDEFGRLVRRVFSREVR